MQNKYDEANERTRAEHGTSIAATATGYTWGCSCGRAGRGAGAPSYKSAQAAANRHLNTEYRRILAEIERTVLGQ